MRRSDRQSEANKGNRDNKKGRELSGEMKAIPDPAPLIGDSRRRRSRTQQCRPWPANQTTAATAAAAAEEETVSVEAEGRACLDFIYATSVWRHRSYRNLTQVSCFRLCPSFFILFLVLPIVILFAFFSVNVGPSWGKTLTHGLVCCTWFDPT